MHEIARDVNQRTSGLRAVQQWWVVGIEGVVALAIGIFIVASPIDASDIIRILLAIALLLFSAGQIVDGFRSWNRPSSSWSTLSGGAGAMAAALVLLAERSIDIEAAGARQILAIGLLVFGIIGLASIIFTIRSNGFRISMFIIDIVAIAIGILLLTAQANDLRGTQLLGIIAIVGGVALLIYAYILWSKGRRPA